MIHGSKVWMTGHGMKTQHRELKKCEDKKTTFFFFKKSWSHQIVSTALMDVLFKNHCSMVIITEKTPLVPVSSNLHFMKHYQ